MENTLKDAWDSNSQWPSIIYIETTNNCNANCLCCVNDICIKKRGVMSLETFKTIADKIKLKMYKVGAMFCFGEPLLDETIFKKYEYAIKIGILNTGIIGLNTNVSLLTKEKFKDIIDYTPNITLSFFNTGKEYERLTGGLSWEKSYKNAIDFIKFRDEYKPKYPIFIGVNTVKDHDLQKVKDAFKGYNVSYVQDAEIRWRGSVITGVIDRMIMYNNWRCDGLKGALHIKFDGSCEYCAYDVKGKEDGYGETKFGNILFDSWEEIENNFIQKWKEGSSLCKRCEYWHKCKSVISNDYSRPSPLPDNWFDWQDQFLKKGENYGF